MDRRQSCGAVRVIPISLLPRPLARVDPASAAERTDTVRYSGPMARECRFSERAWAFVADAGRTFRAAKLQKRGEKLYYDDRCSEAITPLQAAIALVGEPQNGSVLIGVQFTVVVFSWTLLAYAAARSGNQQLALAAIEGGLVRVAEARALSPGVGTDEFLRAWEAWARSYRRSAGGPDA
jgi:hypothetical protein